MEALVSDPDKIKDKELFDNRSAVVLRRLNQMGYLTKEDIQREGLLGTLRVCAPEPKRNNGERPRLYFENVGMVSMSCCGVGVHVAVVLWNDISTFPMIVEQLLSMQLNLNMIPKFNITYIIMIYTIQMYYL